MRVKITVTGIYDLPPDILIGKVDEEDLEVLKIDGQSAMPVIAFLRKVTEENLEYWTFDQSLDHKIGLLCEEEACTIDEVKEG